MNPAVPHNLGRVRVIYIAGSGHSGSTLLALLLDCHPEITCVGETSVKPKIRRRGDALTGRCSCGALVSSCPRWTEIFQRVSSQGLEFDAAHWTNDYRFEHPLAQRLLARASASAWGPTYVATTAQLPLLRRRVRRIDAVNLAFMRAAIAASGARVFADTTKIVSRALYLRRLPEVDLRLVHLVRDVRAYAASAKRRGHSVENAARTWRRDQESVGALVRRMPSQSLLLRYEDLCHDPSAALQEVWALADVSDAGMPFEVNSNDHHVLGNSMRMQGSLSIRQDDSWKQRLSQSEIRRVERIAGPVLCRLGYSPA